jgi:hypothetical protein
MFTAASGRQGRGPSRPPRHLLDVSEQTARRLIADGNRYRLSKTLIRVNLKQVDAAMRAIANARWR